MASTETLFFADLDNFNATFYEEILIEVNRLFIPPPWWKQMVWITLFAGIMVVATVGNLVFIWIVLADKEMRTVTNYFLVNQTIADLMSTPSSILNLTNILLKDWPFGHFCCKMTEFIGVLSVSASVFSLLAISVDRYVAIMSPLRPRLSKRMTIYIIAAIWVLSSIIGSPCCIYANMDTVVLPDSSIRKVCFKEWPDQQVFTMYNVGAMVLTYFLPIIVMTFVYTRVGIELWGSQLIGECSQNQLDNVKSKRKVVKMVIVIVVTFTVCWLPHQVYFLVLSQYPELYQEYTYMMDIYLGTYWLAMSNSMCNPIIFYCMNLKFRRGFKRFFSCCGVLGGGGLTRRRLFSTDRLRGSVRYSKEGGIEVPVELQGTALTTARA